MYLNKKKKEELEVLELFRKNFLDFPKGILKSSESPDFVLSLSPRKKIGIELGRISQRSPGTDLFSYENISACISSKNEKLVLYYKRQFQLYWLILHIPSGAIQPRYNLHNKLSVWNFVSKFDRIFLFNPIHEELFVIHTRS